MQKLLVNLAVALALSTSPVAAHEFKLGDLTIRHPWARATPPGAQVGVAYLTIANAGSAPDRLTAIATPVASAAEVHEMSMSGDVMQMRRLEGGLEIPAGGEVVLAPSGLHVMLVELTGPIKPGEPIKATLTFEKAGAIEVELKVEKIGAMQSSEE